MAIPPNIILFFGLNLCISYAVTTYGHQVKCVENGRFYRDPDRPTHKIWTSAECSKYFLCLEGEVFDFTCSSGLFFDVKRQICDVKNNVDNCDITSDATPETCPKNQSPCRDGTCLPQYYFCDGSLDCLDNSDEAFCDTAHNPNPAPSCNQSNCVLPNCFCSNDGMEIPGNLDPTQIPQMILLTFDGPVNLANWESYEKIFDDFQNPNGCPIKATFFLPHRHNNYFLSQKLWNRGHEIAVNSITVRKPGFWWAHNATLEDWFDEMVGQANILRKYSGVRLNEIRGMRAPFLQIGWNRQFLMMKEFGFLYDSSIVAPFSNPPIWPYTLDHKIPHDCESNIQNCPTRSYEGIWEMPLNQLEADGFSCVKIDSCPGNLTGDDVYRILMHNFKRHYYTNRAPFGLYLRANWLKKQENLEALQDFMADILQQPDVWFVTNWEVINWVKKPTPINRLKSFKEWNCNSSFNPNEIPCTEPNVCKLNSSHFKQESYLTTCYQCPKYYPWLRNEFGTAL